MPVFLSPRITIFTGGKGQIREADQTSSKLELHGGSPHATHVCFRTERGRYGWRAGKARCWGWAAGRPPRFHRGGPRRHFPQAGGVKARSDSAPARKWSPLKLDVLGTPDSWGPGPAAGGAGVQLPGFPQLAPNLLLHSPGIFSTVLQSVTIFRATHRWSWSWSTK